MAKTKQYLLDTNILIEFMWKNPVVTSKLIDVGFEQCCMSVISLYELYFGAHNAKRRKEEYYKQEILRIRRLVEKIDVHPLPVNADEYGQIKYTLAKKGKPIDEFDMIIAGHALSEGLTVVTDNTEHFGRIDGLKIENWMER